MVFAHSKNPAGVRHDLVAHLRAVAETASRFALGLDADRLAFYAGLWHDLGKYSRDLQEYLRRSEDPDASYDLSHGRVDHSTAGVQHASATLPNPSGRLLAY